MTTYHPHTFEDLAIMLFDIENLYKISAIDAWQKDLPKTIQLFLEREHFAKKWQEIKANTSNLESFQKRFFQWFDAFKAMKYVHFARDHFYFNLPVKEAVENWLQKHASLDTHIDEKRDYLIYFRSLDRQPK
ncbi:MAG: hypothetical protein AAF705_16855 [Bacteroidota bacterium]